MTNRLATRLRPLLGLLIALVVMALLAVLLPGYLMGEFTRIWALALAAISLDVLLGYGGLFSLGHAAFLGVGAYTAGMLAVRFGITNVWLGLGCSVLVAALVGAAFGAVALRGRGAYFLLLTFALSQLLVVLATVWDFLSPNAYGSVGVTGIMPPTVAGSGSFLGDSGLYWLAGGLLIGCYLLLRRFLASPTGLALQGSRENEKRMNALGYRSTGVQYTAFVIAAAVAGLAGALLVYHDGIATPGLFSVSESTILILMVLVGGAGTLWGPVVGAIAVTLAEYFISGALVQRWPLILGALYVAVIMLVRGGIAGSLGSRRVTGWVAALTDRLPSWVRAALLLGQARDSPSAAIDVGAPEVARAESPSAVDDEIVLATDHLVRQFGGLRAVDDVSLTIHEGERVALIGTNGAGKSTLFNLIGGAIAPDAGRVQLAGRDITTLPVRLRAQAGLARSFQINSLFAGMTVAENVWLAAGAREPWRNGLWRSVSRHTKTAAAVDALLQAWGLAGRRDDRVTDLGYGEQRRLEIALAFAASPRIVLLDEPTAGLSVAESEQLAAHLRALDRSVTVLVIAHDLELVFAVADRVLVMHQGRIVASGSPDEIRANEYVQELYLATVGLDGGEQL